MPRTRIRSRPPAAACLALAAAMIVGCATASPPPPAGVPERARSAESYSATLRVSLKGPSVRARTRALVAFQRPDALRLEIPGPTGVRLVAVARAGRLVAVFPGDRAVFESAATAADFDALLGVALTPEEVMGLLVGTPTSRLRRYDARWGAAVPREIHATLPDGGRLQVVVEDAELNGTVPSEAFAEPPHDGYRRVGPEEARSLWGSR